MRLLPRPVHFVILAGYGFGGAALYLGLPEPDPACLDDPRARHGVDRRPDGRVPAANRRLDHRRPASKPLRPRIHSTSRARRTSWRSTTPSCCASVLHHGRARGDARRRARYVMESPVGSAVRVRDAGPCDDQHRQSPAADAAQPRDWHPYRPHAVEPCALDPNAPIGGLHAGGARLHHRALGHCGATPDRPRDDSRRRAAPRLVGDLFLLRHSSMSRRMTIVERPLLTPPERVPTFDVLGLVLRACRVWRVRRGWR